MSHAARSLFRAIFLLSLASSAWAQVNYDESQVPAYVLPDPLEGVTASGQWAGRRVQLMELLERHVYGRMPGDHPATVTASPGSRSSLGGKATRKELLIAFASSGRAVASMRVLLYLPNGVEGPAPLFIGLNFWGNHTVASDPGITANPATEKERKRGSRTNRWPVAKIIDHGYALATIYYGDIDPDDHDGFENGVHPLFPMMNEGKRSDDAWGSIGAWAWGLSRALDELVKDPAIDADRVALMGHSRLAKTALWAGACDERFKVVISNNSGCGGAALSRRRFGETVARINEVFPHWFCSRFKSYGGNEDALPVDQHTLIACIAPRACLVSSAEQDRWADPRGEFLAVLAAEPVYRMLGQQGLPSKEMPAIEGTPTGQIGYRIRAGKHDVTSGDWDAYLAFADRVLGTRR